MGSKKMTTTQESVSEQADGCKTLEDCKEIEEVHQEPIIGRVSDCENLRVRKEPDDRAEVLDTIPVGTEVMIDEDESADEFYKVYTDSGLEGFCMKKYIAV